MKNEERLGRAINLLRQEGVTDAEILSELQRENIPALNDLLKKGIRDSGGRGATDVLDSAGGMWAAEWTKSKGESNVQPKGLFDEFRVGAGSALTGMGLSLRQMGASMFGDDADVAALRREAQAKEALDEPVTLGTPGGVLGSLAWDSATAALPIPGANPIARMAGSALVGGVHGSLQPTTEDNDRTKNIILGAGLGVLPDAVISGGTKAIRGLNSNRPQLSAVADDIADEVNWLEETNINPTLGQLGLPLGNITEAASQLNLTKSRQKRLEAESAAAARGVQTEAEDLRADYTSPDQIGPEPGKLNVKLEVNELRHRAEAGRVVAKSASRQEGKVRRSVGRLFDEAEELDASLNLEMQIPENMIEAADLGLGQISATAEEFGMRSLAQKLDAIVQAKEPLDFKDFRVLRNELNAMIKQMKKKVDAGDKPGTELRILNSVRNGLERDWEKYVGQDENLKNLYRRAADKYKTDFLDVFKIKQVAALKDKNFDPETVIDAFTGESTESAARILNGIDDAGKDALKFMYISRASDAFQAGAWKEGLARLKPSKASQLLFNSDELDRLNMIGRALSKVGDRGDELDLTKVAQAATGDPNALRSLGSRFGQFSVAFITALSYLGEKINTSTKLRNVLLASPNLGPKTRVATDVIRGTTLGGMYNAEGIEEQTNAP